MAKKKNPVKSIKYQVHCTLFK